jgi:hypothetical protein
LIEAKQVLIGNAPDETRRGRIGGIALRIDRRRVSRRVASRSITRRGITRRGIAMRVVPKQQHLVKRYGNILEHATERSDEETVPIIRSIGRFTRGRWRRSTIGWGSPG